MTSSKKIQLTKECALIAEMFADKRCDDKTLYKIRGGFKRSDIIAGALGEMGVAIYLRSLGYAVKNPDLTIHAKKTFSADLSDGILDFHVKAQTLTSEKLYGSSWILQRTDRLTKTPKENEYLVLCGVDTKELIVDIKAVLPATLFIEKNLFQECKVEWFRKTKVALYLTHIKKKVLKMYQLRKKRGKNV